MEKKNRYLLYSIFYASLLLVAIGIYTYGYNPPTCNPPGCNLPAPINAGPNPQTKEGDLTVKGNFTTEGILTTESFKMLAGASANKVLTTNASGVATWQEAGGGWDGILPNYTTAQRNALSLADGLIVYNTTDKAVQIYRSGSWANVGAKLSLLAACTLGGECDSTHCEDGLCCATGCTGNCNHCNVAGSIGTCIDVASDCTGNCDICSSGNCAASASLCTATCTECTGAGTAYSCSPVASGQSGLNCTATHYRCDGAGTCAAPTTSPIWYVNVGSGFSCSVYCFNKNMSCNGGRMVRLSDGYIWYYGCSDTLIGDYGTARTNDCACAAYLYN